MLEPKIGTTAGEQQLVRFLVVTAHRLERFLEAFMPKLNALKVGISTDPDADYGPVVTQAHKDRVEGLIGQAETEGATVLVDGRGFTLARHLRLIGFTGRLRAAGHVLADQYTMARRSGFDEIEISDDLAARQPEDQWLFRSDWQEHDYRAKLQQSV